MTGLPSNDEEDYALDVGAGVIPSAFVAGEPIADPVLRAGIGPSARIADWDPAQGAPR